MCTWCGADYAASHTAEPFNPAKLRRTRKERNAEVLQKTRLLPEDRTLLNWIRNLEMMSLAMNTCQLSGKMLPAGPKLGPASL